MITFMRRYRRTLQIGLLVIVAAFVASLFIFGTSTRDGGAARDSVATGAEEDEAPVVIGMEPETQVVQASVEARFTMTQPGSLRA